MKNTHVSLKLEIVEYSDSDPDGPASRQLIFDGHNGYQHMTFSRGIPTAREIELLAQLSAIINELAGVSSDDK